MIALVLGSVAAALVADAVLDPDKRLAVRRRLRAYRRARALKRGDHAEIAALEAGLGAARAQWVRCTSDGHYALARNHSRAAKRIERRLARLR